MKIDQDKLRDMLHELAAVLAKTNEPIKDIILIKKGKAVLMVLDSGYSYEINIEGYSPFGIIRQILVNYED